MAIRSLITKVHSYLPRLRRLDPIVGETVDTILEMLTKLDSGAAEEKRWINPPLIASDFTTDTGAWTVSNASRSYRFVDEGTLAYNITVINSTIPASAYLRVKLPDCTVAKSCLDLIHLNINGVVEVGFFQGVVGETFIRILKTSGNLPAGTINVAGVFTVPVNRRSVA